MKALSPRAAPHVMTPYERQFSGTAARAAFAACFALSAASLAAAWLLGGARLASAIAASEADSRASMVALRVLSVMW